MEKRGKMADYRIKTASYANIDRMRARTMHMMGDSAYEYVDGNTVRKPQVYELPEEEEIRKPEKKKNNVKKIKEERAIRFRNVSSLTAFNTVVLIVVTVFALSFCVKYLDIQAQISDRNTKISELEKSITNITSQNDSLDYSVNSYIDVDKVYKIATEELGMIVAGENQIKLYESSELEYMKQYADIPEK